VPFQAKLDWKYEDTPTEDDANRWEQGISEAVTAVEDHGPRLASLETRVKTLEDAVLNDFKNNRFTVSFANPAGVKIQRGWFDPANARLMIK